MSDTYLERVEEVLTLLALGTQKKGTPKPHRLKLSSLYNGVMPFIVDDETDTGARFLRPKEKGYKPSLMNVAVECREDTKFVQFIRTLPVSKKQMRGRVPLTPGPKVLVNFSMVDRDTGVYDSVRSLMCLRNGKWVRPIRNTHGRWFFDYDEDIHRSLIMGSSIEETEYYLWRVRLGWAGHPKVTVPTTPKGAKELFKMRDVPPGKKRRAALRHWVRRHTRTNPKNPGVHTVRAHLRAATSFSWNGLEGTIFPSQLDLERNEGMHQEYDGLTAIEVMDLEATEEEDNE